MKIKNSNKLIITSLFVLLSIGLTLVCPVRLVNTVPTQFKVRNVSLNINDVFNSSFDAQIEQFMNEGYIPSLAASVIYKDKIVWAKGYGNQSDMDTVYYLYSITKAFTATAILQLHEQGLINLNDDVNDTLPFNLRNPSYPDIPITYRHLLSHRSSIIETWSNLISISGISSFPDYLISWDWDYHGQPGTSKVYTNLNFVLLGYLVELISNKTIEDYFSDNILGPLNMSNTRWKPSDYENESCLAIQYEGSYPSKKYVEQPHEDLNIPGADGLRSTVSDLSHFLIAHMNGGMYNNVHILTDSSIELMHTTGLGWETDIDDAESRFPWLNALPTSDYRTNLQGIIGGHQGYPLKYMVFDSTSEIGLIVFQNQGFANIPTPEINLLTLQGYILKTAGVPKVTTPTTTTQSSPSWTPIIVLMSITALLIFRKKKKHH
jgi:CubicO group peptidase (beta-lactamase class C family)